MKKIIVTMLLAIAIFIFTVLFIQFLLKSKAEDAALVAIIPAIVSIMQPFITKFLEQKSNNQEVIPSHVSIQEEYTPELGYYIGIDLGRYKIDACIVEYILHEDGKVYCEPRETKGFARRGEFITEDTEQIREEISITLNELLKKIKEEYKGTIKGIGIGLPAQIDPVNGSILESPGFPPLRSLNYYKHKINPSYVKIDQSIMIAADNDVRCAARYLWKEKELTDAICIFCGSGLGSGLILNGILYYGSSFTAGEIGHTSISGCFDKEDNEDIKCFFDILDMNERYCGCKKKNQRGGKGYHFESVSSSNGLIKIAKKIDLNSYNLLMEEMKNDNYKKKYKELLKSSYFYGYEEYITEHCLKIGKNKIKDILSTHILSLAYYSGDKYATRVVRAFNRYLAIGISNAINTLNPKVVYLDGGMICGFYKNNLLPKEADHSMILELSEEIRDYCLPAVQLNLNNDFIQVVDSENAIAPIGAAMIFIDSTYRNQLKTKSYKTIKCDKAGNLS